jgi:hypothetical protein
MEFVRAKICTHRSEAMQEFVRRSPVLFVSSIDAAGNRGNQGQGKPAPRSRGARAGAFAAVGAWQHELY